MKTAKTAEPTIVHDLRPERTECPYCSRLMSTDYSNRRTVHTLAGVTRLNLAVCRCHNPNCAFHKRSYRPEAEGSFALPRHEFGLDVIALIGRLRYTAHRSVPEIRAHLVGRKVSVSERTVTNLLGRYDELLARSLADDYRLRKTLVEQKRVILALDELRPDAGDEVLWVVRDVLSGEILLAKSLLSAQNQDPAELLNAVKASCPVPVSGVVPDRHHSIRKAGEDVPRCAGCRTPLPDQALLWAPRHEFDQVPAPGLCWPGDAGSAPRRLSAPRRPHFRTSSKRCSG